MAEEKGLTVIDEAKRKFELACKDASALQIVNNFGAAFTAVNVIALLREALSDEVSYRNSTSNHNCIYAAYEHEGRLSYRP